jgi:glutamine amidotransferase
MSHDPNAATSQQEITARNRMFNVDGFGIAWYTRAQEEFGEEVGPRPALSKHSAPPGNDLAFHSLCQNTHTTNVLAHIRMASATPVVPVNNHPFVFGRHTIMHNGLISNFSDIKRDMLDLMGKDEYENIKGGTDSEHLAALYMTRLVNSKGAKGWEDAYSAQAMKQALEQACHEVFDLQQKILGVQNAEANSLNICCSDGERMIAFRLRNHAREQPPSLYWSDSAGKHVFLLRASCCTNHITRYHAQPKVS